MKPGDERQAEASISIYFYIRKTRAIASSVNAPFIFAWVGE